MELVRSALQKVVAVAYKADNEPNFGKETTLKRAFIAASVSFCLDLL